MRTLSRIALAAATAASALAVTAAPASAGWPVPCEAPATVGPCFVHDPNGPYTCTTAYVEVGDARACVVEWAP